VLTKTDKLYRDLIKQQTEELLYRCGVDLNGEPKKVDIADIARKNNLTIYFANFDNDSIKCGVDMGVKRSIYLAKNFESKNRIFTLAQALYIILYENSRSTFALKANFNPYVSFEFLEPRSEYFAENLLMPELFFRKQFEKYRMKIEIRGRMVVGEVIERLSEFFYVPKEAVVARLGDLGL
jgi:Zn-dependent peptidase ImmA (M78 family)